MGMGQNKDVNINNFNYNNYQGFAGHGVIKKKLLNKENNDLVLTQYNQELNNLLENLV